MTKAFVKLMRGNKTDQLRRDDPAAFTLLTTIALRANRDKEPNEMGLKQGEAIVGDYRNYGLSRQEYRGALLRLKGNQPSNQRITIQATNKGTIARLVDNSIYDININSSNQPSNQPTTNQATTNKNIKNKESKEVIKDSTSNNGQFDTFWSKYPNKKGKGAARKVFSRIEPNEQLFERILSAVEQQKSSEQWIRDNGQYIPHPATWLSQERWDDEVEIKDNKNGCSTNSGSNQPAEPYIR